MAGAPRWKSMLRPIWNHVRSATIVDGGADAAKTVFLSSGARTGSTWVSEIINFENDYRFLFEPFSMVVPLRPSWAPRLEPDDRLRYIRPECDDRDLLEQAARVVSGRLRHPEVDQYNYNARVAFDRRLVKETKSNLFLKWLHRHFPQMKLLLLMRHPIPTVLSRLQRRGRHRSARAATPNIAVSCSDNRNLSKIISRRFAKCSNRRPRSWSSGSRCGASRITCRCINSPRARSTSCSTRRCASIRKENCAGSIASWGRTLTTTNSSASGAVCGGRLRRSIATSKNFRTAGT